jgi:hypothetical protein
MYLRSGKKVASDKASTSSCLGVERAVGADLQIGILARLEGLIGFLVPGLERQFQRLQGRLAVGEGIKLSSLQILGAACFPLRLRNEVFVQGAIFL